MFWWLIWSINFMLKEIKKRLDMHCLLGSLSLLYGSALIDVIRKSCHQLIWVKYANKWFNSIWRRCTSSKKRLRDSICSDFWLVSRRSSRKYNGLRDRAVHRSNLKKIKIVISEKVVSEAKMDLKRTFNNIQRFDHKLIQSILEFLTL